jgi:hypothetical protein
MALDMITPARAPKKEQRLSTVEKAMLFDLAAAAAEREGDGAPAQAQLVLAFAHAYLQIRDRAEGIV